ncbi:MAG: Gfo/Idh/MocA family oxidoreductase [Fimbriiglobus sp.]
MATSLSRRGFLSTSLAGGAILALPAQVYRSAFAAEDKPSERVRLGFIGVGGQGTNNLNAFLKLKNLAVVGLCDVDQKHLAKATDVATKAGMKPVGYEDYRKLLEAKDLDGVVITTPDHWHALQTIHACQAGKDVYCEKPLSLTISEGQLMLKAARDSKRVVQTGSQQRSGKEFKRACELVRNGAIGKVTSVKVGLPGPNFKGPAIADGKAPAELNYDLWLGPAPERAYNEKRVHYLFRFFWDYSGGQQTNFGAHHLDIAQWGLGMDESGPIKVSAKATFHKDGWYEVPETSEITYTYANGITMLCGQGFPQGTEFIGEKGSVFVTRGKYVVKPTELEKATTIATELAGSPGHHQNWLDCLKSRKAPVADVAIGHRSATVCHLGNIAVRTGKTLEWDPVKEVIVGNSEAAKLTSKDYRAPWKL